MSHLLDPTELGAIADRITAHATATRARAHALGCATAHVQWSGPAADTFAGAATDVVCGLRRAAARLDDAAEALRRHAARISAATELAAIEHALTHGVLSGALESAVSLVGL